MNKLVEYGNTCKICGFKTRKMWSHIKKEHKLTEKEYYDKFFKSDDEGICKECGEPTKFVVRKCCYRTVCSLSCNTAYNNHKIKTDPIRAAKQVAHLKEIWNDEEKAEHIREVLRSNGSWEGGNATMLALRSDPEYDRQFRDRMAENGFRRLHKKKWFQELRKEAASKQSIAQVADPNNNWGTRKNYLVNYKGTIMRSGWEATLAGMFDDLDIVWEYEQTFFRIEHGKRYTPDFYLPECHLYIEVKPNRYVDEEAKKKLAFVKSKGFNTVMLTEDGLNKHFVKQLFRTNVIL